MSKRIEITPGQRYNKLTVLEELPMGPNGRVIRCQCDCGNIKDILMLHLIRFKVISCGCYRKQIHTKHGMHSSREYSTWENMIQRCTNPKARKYHLYGGRGITVCDRWLKSFQDFYEDMGFRPENTSLDRIDNDKGYFKENCKWSTSKEQAVNVRIFNHRVKNNGVVKTIEEWLIDLKLHRDVFKSRVLRGLSFKSALLADVDIIVLDTAKKQQWVYHINEFVDEFGFDKEKILDLIDNDHEEPYKGCLFRYLVDFKEWPAKYVN